MRPFTRRGLFGMIGWLASGALLSLVGCGRRARRPDAAPPAPSPLSSNPPPALPAAAAPAVTASAPPAASAVVGATPSGGGRADLVLLNAKVITLDPADTIAQAVAVQGNRILSVGSDAAMRALLKPGSQALDLKGKAVTPGLIDPHNHFQLMGLMGTFYIAFMPPEVKSIKELQSKLVQTLATRPKGEWLTGYYLAMTEGRMPNRQDLDPVSPDHPVWLMQQGGHYGSANSAALKLAGISASGPADPVGGVIERGTNGEPTGLFYNHRAMDLLRRAMPTQTVEMVRASIAATGQVFAACGITTFHDNNIRSLDALRAYQEASAAGQVPLRGAIYYTLEWPADLDRALKEVKLGGDAFMRVAGFKFLIDGQAQMAYCHQPHQGVKWNIPTWEPTSFKRAVRALHDAGGQVCVHCVGDAAVDLTLDAYEEAQRANPRPEARHRLEHCVLCTPQSIQRMKALGVVVSTQPAFIRLGADSYTSLFGAERSRRIMVTRDWLAAGVPLALGSDAPTTPWYTPQVTLAMAVLRVSATNQAFLPEQKLTIQEALRAHTLGGAYAGHEEASKGSIEVGKLADLAVWNEDPTAVPPARLAQLTVATTIVDGKVIYQA